MNWRLLSKFLCKFPIWISCAIGYHTDRIGGVATGVFVRLHFVPPIRRPARVVRRSTTRSFSQYWGVAKW